MMNFSLLLVGIAIVTLVSCGKQVDPPPGPSPLPLPSPTPAPPSGPSPLPLPEGEKIVRMPEEHDLLAAINKKGEVRILNYPKQFDVALSVASKVWSHPVEEDPDKTKSPYTPFTCEKLETFAKVAGSTNPHLPEEAKRNALFWLRDAHEVILKASFPHLPGLGASFIPKIRKSLGDKNSTYPELSILNPLDPGSITLVGVEKKKETALTVKAGHYEQLGSRFSVFFSSFAPLETPFVQKPLAFRDVLCDLNDNAITLWFSISTKEKESPTTINFQLILKKEEQ